jgi:hypothetical protein
LDELPNASELRYIPLPNGTTAPINETEPAQLFSENNQAKETEPEAPAPPEHVTSETPTEVAVEPGPPIDLSDLAKGGDGAKSEEPKNEE